MVSACEEQGKNTSKLILSVCIPTYNRATYLHECIKSIIESQKGYEQQVEIVVSDNASVDNTPNVIQAFQTQVDNIRYYRNEENIGADQNLVRVGGRATGEYIWLFGDDDKMDINAVPAVLERIKHKCNLIIVNFSCHSVDLSVKITSAYYAVNIPSHINDHDQLLKIFGGTIGLISAVVMHSSIVKHRKDAKLKLGIMYGFPFTPAIYTDMAKCCNVEFISEPLVMNRTGNSGGYDWNTYFTKNMPLLIEELSAAGYSKASIRAANNMTIQCYIWRRIASLKINGGAWRDIYAGLWKYSRYCWAFWFLCVPIAIFPCFFLRIVRYLARMLVKINRLRC